MVKPVEETPIEAKDPIKKDQYINRILNFRNNKQGPAILHEDINDKPSSGMNMVIFEQNENLLVTQSKLPKKSHSRVASFNNVPYTSNQNED